MDCAIGAAGAFLIIMMTAALPGIDKPGGTAGNADIQPGCRSLSGESRSFQKTGRVMVKDGISGYENIRKLKEIQ